MSRLVRRPQYHFTAASGWINDPNGLVWREGVWHLFYQHVPAGTHGQCWGHATSTDLALWKEEPIALRPDDLGNIWSGSAVTDGERIVAVFTHQLPERQAQSLAFSEDGGRTFVPYAKNPVLSADVPDFRDPKVFRYAPANCWIMAVAAGVAARFYTSPDLINWTKLSDFEGDFGSWKRVWECPDLFPLVAPDGSRKWVMIGSVIDAPNVQNTVYWIGQFDGVRFVPETSAFPLSFGADDYAAVSWNHAPDERRIIIGWMNRWSYAAKVPSVPWQGALTLPRELNLAEGPEGLRMLQRPAEELENLRGPGFAKIDFAQDGRRDLPVKSAAFEVRLDVELGKNSSLWLELGGGEGSLTVVGYDAASRELFIDRTHSGYTDLHPDFAARHAVPVIVEDGALDLHLFVDTCSVELFARGGRNYAADLIFPGEGPISLAVVTSGAEVLFHSLEVWPLGE